MPSEGAPSRRKARPLRYVSQVEWPSCDGHVLLARCGAVTHSKRRSSRRARRSSRFSTSGRRIWAATESRAWKHRLQQFADETRLRVHVGHFPPGTGKWDRIEHRLFCHIAQNWRGRPLRTFEGRRRPDRQHADRGRTSGRGRTRRGRVSHRRDGHEGGDRRPVAASGRLPRRLEPRTASTMKLETQYLRDSLPCMEVRPQRWGNCRYFLTASAVGDASPAEGSWQPVGLRTAQAGRMPTG